MIKLLAFEIKKLLTKKTVTVLTVLLVLNLVSVHYQQTVKYKNPALYYSYYQQTIYVSNQLGEKAYGAISQECQRIIEWMNNNPSGRGYWSCMLSEKIDTTQDLSVLLSALDRCKNDINYIEEYHSRIRSVVEKSGEIMNVGIFSTPFSVKNAQKTMHDYSRVSNLSIQQKDVFAFSEFVSSKYTLIIAIIFVVYCIGNSIVKERNGGFLPVLQSTKYHKYIWIIKYSSIAAVAVFTLLLFLLTNVAYYEIQYGFKCWMLPIQTCYVFSNFTLPLNCMEGLFLYYFYQSLILLTISGGVFFIQYYIPNIPLAISLISIIVLLEQYLVQVISFQSNFSLLRYFNLFTLMNFEFCVAQYHNIMINHSLVSYPLSVLYVFVFVSCFHVICLRTIPPFDIPKIHLPLEKLRKKCSMTSHTGYFRHIIIQIMFHEKSVVVLIIFICFLFAGSASYRRNTSELSFRNVIDRYHGPITDRLISEIEAENKEIQDLSDQLENLYQGTMNGTISLEEYYAARDIYEPVLQNQTDIMRLLNTVYRISGENTAVLDWKGYEYLFDFQTDNSRMNGVSMDYYVLVMTLIVILSFSGCETENFLWEIYTELKMQKKFQRKRHLFVVLVSFLLCTLFHVWKFISIHQYYSISIRDCIYSINSIYELHGILKENVTIGLSFLLMFFFRFLILLLYGEIIMFISRKCQNQIVTLLFSVLILVVPSFALYYRYPLSQRYFLMYHFVDSGALRLDSSFCLRIAFTVVLLLVLISYNVTVRPQNSNVPKRIHKNTKTT